MIYFSFSDENFRHIGNWIPEQWSIDEKKMRSYGLYLNNRVKLTIARVRKINRLLKLRDLDNLEIACLRFREEGAIHIEFMRGPDE